MREEGLRCPHCGKPIKIIFVIRGNGSESESEEQNLSYSDIIRLRRRIFEIVKSLDVIYPNGVPIRRIIERGESEGISESVIREIVEDLRLKGEIIEVRRESFRPFRSIIRGRER